MWEKEARRLREVVQELWEEEQDRDERLTADRQHLLTLFARWEMSQFLAEGKDASGAPLSKGNVSDGEGEADHKDDHRT